MAGSKSGIRRAHASDFETISGVLESVGLPTDDLTRAASLQFWVLESEALLIGVIGLQGFVHAGLLRSLAILPAHRRRGLAEKLVAHLEQEAHADGIRQLVLLTLTAVPLFRRLGYRVIDRNSAPDAVKKSEEFLALCPASAICMTKILIPNPTGNADG